MISTHTKRTRVAQINRSLILLFLIAGGMLLALPAWSQLVGDFNEDGAVDFCDGVILIFGFYSGDMIFDLNGDGLLNNFDLAIFGQNYCTGPPKTAIDGTATIGVYFDTAGTINQMVSVPANTFITFYVVAHNLLDPNGTGGYTFEVVENSTALITGDSPPTGFQEIPNGPASNGMCLLGSAETCLGPASTIVLNTYNMLFLGEDTTITVQGANDCSAPSEFPSYVSCGVDGVPCDWTYFAHEEPHGSAFVTSEPVGVVTQTWSTVKALYR